MKNLKQCPNCNKLLPITAANCKYCGTTVNKKDSPSLSDAVNDVFSPPLYRADTAPIAKNTSRSKNFTAPLSTLGTHAAPPSETLRHEVSDDSDADNSEEKTTVMKMPASFLQEMMTTPDDSWENVVVPEKPSLLQDTQDDLSNIADVDDDEPSSLLELPDEEPSDIVTIEETDNTASPIDEFPPASLSPSDSTLSMVGTPPKKRFNATAALPQLRPPIDTLPKNAGPASKDIPRPSGMPSPKKTIMGIPAISSQRPPRKDATDNWIPMVDQSQDENLPPTTATTESETVAPPLRTDLELPMTTPSDTTVTEDSEGTARVDPEELRKKHQRSPIHQKTTHTLNKLTVLGRSAALQSKRIALNAGIVIRRFVQSVTPKCARCYAAFMALPPNTRAIIAGTIGFTLFLGIGTISLLRGGSPPETVQVPLSQSDEDIADASESRQNDASKQASASLMGVSSTDAPDTTKQMKGEMTLNCLPLKRFTDDFPWKKLLTRLVEDDTKGLCHAFCLSPDAMAKRLDEQTVVGPTGDDWYDNGDRLIVYPSKKITSSNANLELSFIDKKLVAIRMNMKNTKAGRQTGKRKLQTLFRRIETTKNHLDQSVTRFADQDLVISLIEDDAKRPTERSLVFSNARQSEWLKDQNQLRRQTEGVLKKAQTAYYGWKFDEALSLFETVLEHHPGLGVALAQSGLILLRKDNFKKARHMAQTLLKKSRDREQIADGYYILAIVALRNGDLHKTRKLLNSAKESAPWDHKHQEALTQLDTGKYTAAHMGKYAAALYCIKQGKSDSSVLGALARGIFPSREVYQDAVDNVKRHRKYKQARRTYLKWECK